jgi:hypothetical protein
MVAVKIPLERLGQYEARLASKGLKEAMGRAVVKSARDALALFQRGTHTAIAASPNGGPPGAIAFGSFLKGWHVYGFAPGDVHVQNRESNAVFVEGGRRPGKPPPISALLPWVRLKLAPANEAQARMKAFLVARAIGKRGLRGREIMKRALPEVVAKHVTNVRVQMELELQKP